MGSILRTLFFVAIFLAVCFLVILPNWETVGPIIVSIISMVFYLVWIAFMMIFQFVAIFWFLGKPRIYWVMPGETGVGFKDYKGNPEVLEAAKQVVTLLRGVKEFKGMGGEPIRGLLLIGSPGTGKSYLGQCIATEAGVPFGYMSAPSIQGMFWGMDMMRVMTLYGKARKLARKYGACILFIDEIDAIGRSRGGAMGAGGMMMGGMMGGNGGAALNELLNQMDPLPRDSWKNRLLRKMGFRRKKSEQMPVLTMAATNIAEVLDAALLRPGRFDRKITVDLPDADGRREILEYYLTKIQHDLSAEMDRLVADTIHYTPVAIKYVINEAVVVAHWDHRDRVNYRDWCQALENHELGLSQPIKSMGVEDRRRIAYHETGHALAMVMCLPRQRLHKVTIIRHGGALGLAIPKPNEEVYTVTKDELLGIMQVSLASRAAEQAFLGLEMSGAHHDLQNATQVADLIVRHYGMGNSLYQPAALGQFAPDMYDTRRIEEVLDEQFQKVKRMLLTYEKSVHAIAAALLEKSELMGDEVLEIIRQVEGPEAVDRHRREGLVDDEYGLPGIFSIVGRKQNGMARRNGTGKPHEPEQPKLPRREAAITEPSEGL
jgi:ATP-dependent Zn protease